MKAVDLIVLIKPIRVARISNANTIQTQLMKIVKSNRLAFRLAKISVLIAFILGLFFSSIQVYLDYQEEEKALDEMMFGVPAESLSESQGRVCAVRTAGRTVPRNAVRRVVWVFI